MEVIYATRADWEGFYSDSQRLQSEACAVVELTAVGPPLVAASRPVWARRDAVETAHQLLDRDIDICDTGRTSSFNA